MDLAKLAEDAKKTIKDCLYLNIASVTSNNEPWNTPVYYTFDSEFTLFWGSPKDSVHSDNIVNNPKVFITIYLPEETATGVYIEAQAYEIKDENELSKVINLLDRKGGQPVNKPQDFLESSPLRLYRAKITKIYVSSPEISGKFNGLWVDHRADISSEFIQSL